jgi:hypothetical protein
MAEHEDDALVEEETAAAAAEAAGIGGRVPEEDEFDPAMRPLYESGQGEAEGFEQAERELQEHAEHGDPAPDPSEVAFTPEAESDRTTAAYGEPDEIDPTEVIRDPDTGEDDPGTGPSIAPDR